MKRLVLKSLCVILVSLNVAWFGSESILNESVADEPGNDHHWSYDGAHGVGPQAWAKVAPHALGTRQSPIKIPVRDPRELTASKLPVKYGKVAIELFHNNGHTWKGTFKTDGGALTLAGKEYRLIQFHVHSPSEHSLQPKTEAEKKIAIDLGATESIVFANGLRSDFHFPMELHLVHKSDDDKLAVIGIFIVPGKTGVPPDAAYMLKCNELIKKNGALWHAYGDQKTQPFEMNMASFLPKKDAYHWYDGSLTTPPCSESVRWIVMCNPIKFQAKWITMFRQSMSLAGHRYTNRPVQNSYSRPVKFVSSGLPHSPPIGNFAGAFEGTWKGKGGSITIDEAVTVVFHTDTGETLGFAKHDGDELQLKFLNGDSDVLKLVDENREFDDLLHSRKSGELTPFGEVAGFVGEWIDGDSNRLIIEEGIGVTWNRKLNGKATQDRFVAEILGNRMTLKRDAETIVLRLANGKLTHNKYGVFAK